MFLSSGEHLRMDKTEYDQSYSYSQNTSGMKKSVSSNLCFSAELEPDLYLGEM